MNFVVIIMTLIFSIFRSHILKVPVISIIILLLSLTFNLPLSAQQKGIRPKVGLALSGGGSLGMAHVGVLKVMEEAGLRPDFISGVSMGSIVGGMYAIGYCPDSLYKIFKATDWNYILSNDLPENKVVFTEKHNFKNSLMSLPITPKKVMLPSGLINGQQIENMLSFYAWPAADINDFSKLPLPFMCVATDIISTKIVDLKKGYLPETMRASMAVPSIFTPIKIDTSLLIDGGVLRNIAVSELKEMGADIIIGSYTGFHRYKEEDLQSAAGILKQIGFLHSVIDYSNQKKLLDIVIEPNLKDYSSTVFTNVDSIVQRGYRAALPYKNYFRKLADSLNLLGNQKTPEYILEKQHYAFDKIEVRGNKVYSDDQILGVLDIKPGEQVNKYLLTEKIELLYGKSWFEKVNYKVESRNDSLILVIACNEREKAVVYGSVHYDNIIRSGIILNVSLKNLISTKNMIDIDAFIGQYYRFRFNFTRFIDRNQELGLSVNMNADNTLLPVVELKGETGQFLNRTYNWGVSLNKMIGLNAMSVFSANIESFNLIPDFISVNKLKRVTYNSYSFGYNYLTNSIDRKYFPNRGTLSDIGVNTTKLLSGRVKTSQYERRYDRDFPDDFQFRRTYSIKGSIKHYFSPGRKVSFSIGANLLYSYYADTALSHNNYYFAGGIAEVTKRSLPMAGFHSNEIPVESFASIGLNTDIEFMRDLHLEILTNGGAAQETGPERTMTFLGGYAFGLGYMSIIGPVRVGFMQGFSSRERYYNSLKGYISLGFCF